MRKEKFYFEEDSEGCCILQTFEERIEEGEKEIKLRLGKMEVGSGFMWCRENGESIERGDGACGKLECTNYKPRNKISGRCIHSVNCYEPTGNILVLTKDGLKEQSQ